MLKDPSDLNLLQFHTVIRPFGDSFDDALRVVRVLNKIVNNYWRGSWISYSAAPRQVKDLWWNEFKAHELGMEPTYFATFERTFQKKDKTWTNNRAKCIKVCKVMYF
ncbi:uncharacterized protein LOC125312632 [Rhodamnia argentea]|uniref:Uncharacterized protein LOC125312632 n=1 Tax=Rhodamnia argentea TaxID=178133 RepID=A0ABM3GSG5_9MYRT|nr:uncharacterized protein LOC125312632 [Rhodamnia argentea]